MQQQSFFHMRCRRMGEIGPKQKIVHFVSTCSRSENRKKTQVFLLFFQTSSPLSRLFPGLENCWANFKTFSRITKRLCTNPDVNISKLV